LIEDIESCFDDSDGAHLDGAIYLRELVALLSASPGSNCVRCGDVGTITYCAGCHAASLAGSLVEYRTASLGSETVTPELIAALRDWETAKRAFDAVRPCFSSNQLRELEAAERRLLAAIHQLASPGSENDQQAEWLDNYEKHITNIAAALGVRLNGSEHQWSDATREILQKIALLSASLGSVQWAREQIHQQLRDVRARLTATQEGEDYDRGVCDACNEAIEQFNTSPGLVSDQGWRWQEESAAPINTFVWAYWEKYGEAHEAKKNARGKWLKPGGDGLQAPSHFCFFPASPVSPAQPKDQP